MNTLPELPTTCTDLADDIPIPESVRNAGNGVWRQRFSVILTTVSLGAIALMVYRVEVHRPVDPMLVADHYPAGTVICCMATAAAAGTTAVLVCIPTLLIRNFTPLFWLVPLMLVTVWFIDWYDWQGLFEHGKAWYRPAALPTLPEPTSPLPGVTD